MPSNRYPLFLLFFSARTDRSPCLSASAPPPARSPAIGVADLLRSLERARPTSSNPPPPRLELRRANPRRSTAQARTAARGAPGGGVGSDGGGVCAARGAREDGVRSEGGWDGEVDGDGVGSAAAGMALARTAAAFARPEELVRTAAPVGGGVRSEGGRVVGETLGGVAAFVSNVLDAASPPEASFSVVSKVGPDFAYASAPAPARHPPLLCAAPTTSFHARFTDAVASAHAPDRQLRRVHACDPIYPDDLPDLRFAYGLAVGVAGEVLPETLERMIRLCRAVLVDAQALIRVFNAEGGGSSAAVCHMALEGTLYAPLLQRVAFLKASSEEAPYIGVETARRRCCVIVTEGRDGCRLYWDGGVRFQSSPAVVTGEMRRPWRSVVAGRGELI